MIVELPFSSTTLRQLPCLHFNGTCFRLRIIFLHFFWLKCHQDSKHIFIIAQSHCFWTFFFVYFSYPIWQRGNPQLRVFLPNFWMKLIKPEEPTPPNIVQFITSQEMTHHDVRNYLEKIYKIPVVDVKVEMKTGKISILSICFPHSLWLLNLFSRRISKMPRERSHN